MNTELGEAPPSPGPRSSDEALLPNRVCLAPPTGVRRGPVLPPGAGQRVFHRLRLSAGDHHAAGSLQRAVHAPEEREERSFLRKCPVLTRPRPSRLAREKHQALPLTSWEMRGPLGRGHGVPKMSMVSGVRSVWTRPGFRAQEHSSPGQVTSPLRACRRQ